MSTHVVASACFAVGGIACAEHAAERGTDTQDLEVIGRRCDGAQQPRFGHTGGDVAIHFEQANIVHLGDLLNNRGYPNVDGPAGASVHCWMQVLEKMAAAYPADALYVFGHAEAGHPFIGTRTDRAATSSAVGAGIRRNIQTKPASGSRNRSPAVAGIQCSGTPA